MQMNSTSPIKSKFKSIRFVLSAFLFSFGIATIAQNAVPRPYHLSEYDLSGPVKSFQSTVHEASADASGKLRVGERKERKVITDPDFAWFNPEGYATKLEYLGSRKGPFELNIFETFQHDAQGRPVKMEVFNAGKTEPKTIEEMKYEGEFMVLKSRYKYDKLQSTREFKYSESGELEYEIDTDIYHQEDDYTGSYDNYGNPVTHDTHDTLYPEYNLAYDMHRRAKPEKVLLEDGRSYNQYLGDTVIFIRYENTSPLPDSTIYIYDSHNHLIFVDHYAKGKQEYSYHHVYEYDEKDNWTRHFKISTFYSNSFFQKMEAEVREIEYY